MPWDLTGNAGTNPVTNPGGTDFLGTTDFRPLAIETNANFIGARPAVFITPANPPTQDRGFVGVGSENPQTPLHVEGDLEVRRPTVHTAGPNAAYSFSVGLGLPPNRSETSGGRWEWSPSPGNPAAPTTDPPRASLWSFNDKLIVTSFGQVLLPGRSGAGGVNFPGVPIGTLTPRPPATPPAPTPPEPGELVLGATRTSIRGFDRPLP
jgi:hypothetical protein